MSTRGVRECRSTVTVRRRTLGNWDLIVDLIPLDRDSSSIILMLSFLSIACSVLLKF